MDIKNLTKPRAVFFDIDDTLLTLEENHIEEAEALGDKYDIFFVTGRNYKSAISLSKKIKYGVFGFGGYIKTPEHEHTIFLETYPKRYKVMSLKKMTAGKNEKVLSEYDIHCLVHKDASKLNGVRHVCKLHNYEYNDIWVVGNSHQDAEMLENFKYSFAVSNAEIEAKKAANFTLNIKEIIDILKKL